MEQPNETVAGNLKKLRENRNLSLDKLSEMTGVSKSMLRQIEIGQSNPTIATIWKIANGLRIPFSTLLQEQAPQITLKPFKQNDPLHSGVDGYSIFPLLAFTPEKPFETYYLEMEPGTVFEAEAHQGNAEEHVFVLQGEIEISVAGELFSVDREQFISFPADRAHRYHSKGAEPAVAIMLISYLP